MSTRWQIAAQLSDGRCGCIYVHYDGYPSYAAKVLREHYTDQDKIDSLIALGDCREVRKEIALCNTFLAKGEKWDEVRPTYGDDLMLVALSHRHGDEQYLYMWDGRSWAVYAL